MKNKTFEVRMYNSVNIPVSRSQVKAIDVFADGYTVMHMELVKGEPCPIIKDSKLRRSYGGTTLYEINASDKLKICVWKWY